MLIHACICVVCVTKIYTQSFAVHYKDSSNLSLYCSVDHTLISFASEFTTSC